MANIQLVDIFQGENRTFNLQARDNSNNPANLTGKTLTFSVAFPPYDPGLSQAVITKTGTIVSASAGTYTVAITPTDTQFLDSGNYTHQTFTTDGAGLVSIVNEGIFRLQPIVQPIT